MTNKIKLRKTKAVEIVILADQRGYRITNKGEIISPFSSLPLKGRLSGRPSHQYREFSIRDERNTSAYVKVHQLVAYQKFGQIALAEKMVVRHKDGNCTNNRVENILIGTMRQNILDISPEDRRSHAIKTSSASRRLTDSQMIELRQDRKAGASYKQLMKKFNISSKGTLYYMLNTKYVTVNCDAK